MALKIVNKFIVFIHAKDASPQKYSVLATVMA